ncbi:hypothetical protein Dimus_035601 [Dionaea muscipula]
MSDTYIEAKPLAPAAAFATTVEPTLTNSTDLYYDGRRRRRRGCIKCCGCSLAVATVVILIIIILAFTVFRVKEPKITLNRVRIQGLDVNFSKPQVNLTLEAEVSIKNPNAASFKFRNSTTSVSYDGVIVGEVQSPPGLARAMKTLRMNITVDVIVDNLLLSSPVSLLSDALGSGSLPFDTFTKISGRVRLINVIKKHVVITMNCSVTVNVKTSDVQEQQCIHHVSL